MHHTDDIVNVFAVYRVTGNAFFEHIVNDFRQKSRLVERHDLLAMRHDIRSESLVELDDVLDHLGFVLLDDTLFVCLIDDGDDLFLCDRSFFLVHPYPKQRGDQPCQVGGRKGQWIQKYAYPVYHIDRAICKCFGFICADPAKSKHTERGNKDDRHHKDSRCSRSIVGNSRQEAR